MQRRRLKNVDDILQKEIIGIVDGQKNGKKVPVMLWSKEQLDIIYSVGRSLFDLKRGCRILITGPKGSGKTMLLVYLAKLAMRIFSSHGNDEDNKICIVDGRLGGSKVLFDSLKSKFENSFVDVLTNIKKIRKYHLILVDEMNMLSVFHPSQICFKTNIKTYLKNLC